MTISRKDLGAAVAHLRARHGLTQAELGKLSGLGQTVVSRIETGDRRLDTVELLTLADRLEASVDEILELARELSGDRTQAGLVALRLKDDADLRQALSWVDGFFDELDRLETLAGE